MIDAVFDNPTQLAGVAAYAAAAAACAWRAASPGRRMASPWSWLSAAHAAFIVELFAGGRFLIRTAANEWLQAHGRYDGRNAWQWLLLVAAVMMAVIVAGIILHWRRRIGGGATVALGATGIAALLIVVEAISPHRVDRVLYARAGPVLAIAWLWLVVAATVVAAALRRAPPARSWPAS